MPRERVVQPRGTSSTKARWPERVWNVRGKTYRLLLRVWLLPRVKWELWKVLSREAAQSVLNFCRIILVILLEIDC